MIVSSGTMLKIRLKRVGRKGDPSFRVVLIDSSKGPKSGKINEVLGFYDPRKNLRKLKGPEIKNWILKGAGISDTVFNLLIDEKIIDGKKINVLPKKSPIIKEKAEEASGSDETLEKNSDAGEAGAETNTNSPEKASEEETSGVEESPPDEGLKTETPKEKEKTLIDASKPEETK